MRFKSWIVCILFVLAGIITNGTKAFAMECEGVNANSDILSVGQGQYTNVVLFVDFSDTVNHAHASDANCFKKTGNADKTFMIFNGTDHNGVMIDKRGMEPYFSTISYGAFHVKNIFPQYDITTNTMNSYILDNTTSYYKDNPSVLISDVMEKLNADDSAKTVMDAYELSHKEAGVLDNVMLVVGCATDGLNDPFGGVTYGSGAGSYMTGDGKQYNVGSFNIIPESGSYLGLSGSGLPIHEFMHSIGYPDLYCRNNTEGYRPIPVGMWDIMASESEFVQYPLAYMRQYISGWISLPTVTTDQTAYTLTAATSTTPDTKNNQAVILKTPYSDSEFFVVEYRQKQESLEGAVPTYNYDTKIAGSGLIIYRINLNARTNITGAPYLAYVFRQNDTRNADGFENGDCDSVTIPTSYLSLECGRTSYGSADVKAGLTDNAITYNDGSNSGIVISNVGSASGNQITFDIHFEDFSNEQGDYWKTMTQVNKGDYSQMDAIMDEDGTIYSLHANSSSVMLMKYTDTFGLQEIKSFSKTGYGYSLGKYNGKIYISFIDGKDEYKVKLMRLDDTVLTQIYATPTNQNGLDMDVGTDGIYLLFGDDQTVKGIKYDGTSSTSLGSVFGTSDYSNPVLAVKNGHVVAMARRWNHNNQLVVREYINGTWRDVGSLKETAQNAIAGIEGDNIYLVLNGKGSGDYSDNRVVGCNLLTDKVWNRIGSNAFSSTASSIMDMGFDVEVPYVLYYSFSSSSNHTFMKYLKNNEWTTLGNEITGEELYGIRSFVYNNKVYVIYGTFTGKVCVKVHDTSDVGDSSDTDTPGEGDNNKISLQDVSIAAIEKQQYTGKQICPTVTLNYNNVKLVPGKDYSVTYSNNVNMGKATISIVGLNGYEGTKKVTFEILAKLKPLSVYNGVDYSAVYDYNYYVKRYPDIWKVFGTDDAKALAHFVNYGMTEERQGNAAFNVTSYAYRYYDLRKAYKNDKKKYYMHYINYGKKEKRVATGTSMMQGGAAVYGGVNYSDVYNVGYYANKYPDLRRAYGFDDMLYIKHFVNYGMAEGRQGNVAFNVTSYAYRYYDLRKAYKNDKKKYYMHYINYGKKEKRVATGTSMMQGGVTAYGGVNYSDVYNVGYYADKYPDLRRAYGFDDMLYIKHFVNYGMAEGRVGSAEFNVNAYKNRYRDLQKVFGNNLKAYYTHYVSFGKKEGRRGI